MKPQGCLKGQQLSLEGHQHIRELRSVKKIICVILTIPYETYFR